MMENLPKSPDEYPDILSRLQHLEDRLAILRTWCKSDLYFLLRYVLKRSDAENKWIFDRCREVQANPDGYLDLWAREHYKSTIITFALTIQDILKDPEITVGILSYNRPAAKDFLRQIKREFEENAFLKQLFPDILYQNPQAESSKWSEDDGIIVRRKTNPKESTVEAWGLVDGQPTRKHFGLIIYDDTVVRESVTTPDMMKKTTEAWELSRNLTKMQGGKTRYIGTRYHFNDTYGEIERRGAAIIRLYPATEEGTEGGTPILMTREQLEEKRRDMGPYTFACHAKGTFVTMADWSQKPIELIEAGDMVVGWGHIKGSKAVLKPTRVVAINKRTALTVKSELENGDVLIHTPDHKWWTGRAPHGDRKTYSPLGFGFSKQKGVCRVIDLLEIHKKKKEDWERAAGYLAAIIDGEGGVKHLTVQITQDPVKHPEVCKQIEWSFETLGLKYSVYERKSRNMRIYTLLGGRTARIRLLSCLGKHFGKREEIIRQCFGARNFGKGCRIKLIKQTELFESDVYNIQTETGNYIADGYASKNCQMLQNPTADEKQGFKYEWTRFYEGLPGDAGMNRYLLIDPANEKKKQSDFSAFIVWGMGQDGNYYLLDIIRDRFNLSERTRTLFDLHKKWKPLRTGYEDYGLKADVQHIRHVMAENHYHFEITGLKNTVNKNDRIRAMIPLFEQSKIWFPQSKYYTNYERKTDELISVFINEEYKPFPVGKHDDMFDAMSRILDPDLGATWPIAAERKERYRDKKPVRHTTWMSR